MRNSLILFLFLSCIGCQQTNNNYKLLVHSDFKLNSEYIGSGGAIIAYENGLIGIEESGSLAPFFVISTNGETHSLTHFGNRGQGPDDFIHPYPIQYIDEDVFGAYDMMSGKYKEIFIPRKGDSIVIRNNVTLASQPLKVIKTAYNQYIGLSSQEGLFTLMDEKGEERSTFFEYPYRDNDEKAIKNPIRAMAYQGIIAANPEKTKCVYASLDGEIIHFYDIEKDNISLIRKIENRYPVYETVNFGTNSSTSASLKNSTGYISIAATDQFVYALYCGKTLEESRIGHSLVWAAEQVRVFDWNGNWVATYKLDVPCRYIYVTNDDKILWAIALTLEATPVYFDLDDNFQQEKEIPTQTVAKIEKELPAVNPAAQIPNNAISSVKGNNAAAQTNQVKIPVDDSQLAALIAKQATAPVKENKTNVGKIGVLEERIYSLVIPASMPVTSFSVTGKDITLKDTLMSNRFVLMIKIKKEQPGIFNDTVTVFMDSKKTKMIYSGEVW